MMDKMSSFSEMLKRADLSEDNFNEFYKKAWHRLKDDVLEFSKEEKIPLITVVEVFEKIATEFLYVALLQVTSLTPSLLKQTLRALYDSNLIFRKEILELHLKNIKSEEFVKEFEQRNN